MTAKSMVLGSLIFGWAASTATAASKEDIDTLFEVIGTPRLLEIMQTEGVDQADELREAMFADRQRGWDPIVASIYDLDQMTATFRASFDDVLEDEDISGLLDFYASDLGREIVNLELAAREAFLDPDVEDAARSVFEDLAGNDPDRLAAIEGFVRSNDLIELNVQGALNSTFNFYKGLSDGGEAELTESQILNDVWGQEPQLREETVDWMFPYLNLAYEPLSLEEIEAYTAFSTSDAGRELNRALFAWCPA